MRTFLKIISYIFQPLLMPFYGMILLMQTNLFSIFSPAYKIIAVAGTLLFTGLLPALPIFMMMRRGQIKDLFISKFGTHSLSMVFWASKNHPQNYTEVENEFLKLCESKK